MAGRLGKFQENSIVVGDCLDVMAKMPDECVDATITDPPYGTKTRGWDNEPTPEMWAEIRRVTKADGVIAVMGYAKQLFRWAQFFEELQLIGFIVWHKYNELVVSPGLTRAHQDIALWGRSVKQARAGEVREPYSKCAHLDVWYAGRQGKYNKEPGSDFGKRLRDNLADDSERRKRHPDGRRCTDIWRIPAPSAGFNSHARLHPNQKPIKLLNKLIRLISTEGDLVFDPFIGSGTTAVAADRLGRRWFGCDVSSDYVAMAMERIEADRLQRSQLALQI